MSEKHRYQVTVIGGGPGGYVAAIKAAQSGQSVALVEKGALGGTCLNVGCIPTKTLIANADVWRKIQTADQYGMHVDNATFDFAKMTDRKNEVVARMTRGIDGLLAANKITLFKGHAKFISSEEIKVLGESDAIIRSDKFIIATGSEPREIPAFPFDHERILSSTSALDLTRLPESIVIIGGGYIGCEFASLYHAFGVRVTIVEMLPQILPTEGSDVGKFMRAAFEKQGIQIKTEVAVEGIDRTQSALSIRLSNGEHLEADCTLVAVGRKLNSDGLDLEKIGLIRDREAILVNERMETSIPGIYAIGDVTGKILLAHVASHQGIVAAINATGGDAVMHYNAVPSVVFTHPEAAAVGLTLHRAQEAGYDAVLGKFPFQALGKAQAALETDGFAQIVVDRRTHQILGAQVVGYEAGTLIAEMAVAIFNELTLESIGDAIHAHPTLPEAWMEAALVAGNMPIHLPPKRSK
jgi:dihydrolipoyl dehydrogenase